MGKWAHVREQPRRRPSETLPSARSRRGAARYPVRPNELDGFVTFATGTNRGAAAYKNTRSIPNHRARSMADLVRDFVPLVRLAESLPVTYERIRQLAHTAAIPTNEEVGGRLHVERGFALRLIDLAQQFDFPTATRISTMTSSNNNGISTSVSELAEIYGVSERRMKTAATNTKGVELCAGMIETDQKALIRLNDYLDAQTA